MCKFDINSKGKHTKLGHTQFITGGNNEPTNYKKGKKII